MGIFSIVLGFLSELWYHLGMVPWEVLRFNGEPGELFRWLVLAVGLLVMITMWQVCTAVVYILWMPFAKNRLKSVFVDIDRCMHFSMDFGKWWIGEDRKVVNRYRKKADLDPISDDEYLSMFMACRDPDGLFAEQLEIARGKPTTVRFMHRKRFWRWPRHVGWNSDLRKALKRLKKELGVTLVAYTDNTIGRRMLFRLGVLAIFRGCIVTPAAFSERKKHLSFWRVLFMNRVYAQQVAIFGDSEGSDMKPPKDAGVLNERCFLTVGPDELIDAITQLIEQEG